jgi:hypothetical protein
MKAQSILETIGNTPHIRMARMFPNAEVWIKSERSNPGGSIKDRIGLAMIEAAERDGSLKPGGTIIEPTSGNTGVGLAMAAAVKGYKLILVMPESMSLERRRLMLAYGAKFDLTPREKGMKGAIERGLELISQTPNSWMPQQFENAANIDVHVRTTALEILEDFSDSPIDAMITGVGTGGHITGCAEVLKKAWPNRGRMRFRGSALGSFLLTCTLLCLMALFRLIPKTPRKWRAGQRVKKVCWWVFHPAQRWPQSHKSSPNCLPEAACSVSIMILANGIFRSQISCLWNKQKCRD